jgi:hypothetical protein
MLRLINYIAGPHARSARTTLGVLADLERSGCRVITARLLPSPAVHIDAPPAGLAHAYAEAPAGAAPLPLEHVATLRGVRITWFATR